MTAWTDFWQAHIAQLNDRQPFNGESITESATEGYKFMVPARFYTYQPRLQR